MKSLLRGVQLFLVLLLLVACGSGAQGQLADDKPVPSADAVSMCTATREWAYANEKARGESQEMGYMLVQSALDALERSAFDTSEPEIQALVDEFVPSYNWPSSAERPWYEIFTQIEERCRAAGAPALRDVDEYLCESVPALRETQRCSAN